MGDSRNQLLMYGAHILPELRPYFTDARQGKLNIVDVYNYNKL